MAKLTTKERKRLPAADFAGPGRSYPVEDKGHARDAKARTSEMEHEGRMSKAEESRIDRKADRVLGTQAHMGRAVDHLERHTERGKHRPTVGGHKMEHR